MCEIDFEKLIIFNKKADIRLYILSLELRLKFTVSFVMSNVLAMPPFPTLKFPLISIASLVLRYPPPVADPTCTLLKDFPAEVNEVVASKIHAEPVVVNVSALVRSSVVPAVEW